MPIRNVFHLENDGAAEFGMSNASQSGVRLAGESCRGAFTGFMHHPKDRSMPEVLGGKLISGAPGRNLIGDPVIMGRGKWKGVLLYIATFNLRFREEYSSYFGEIRNSWPGAEIVGGAFVQLGGRNHADQYQIVAIEDNMSVIIADQDSQYMEVRCENWTLRGSPAPKELLASVLVQRLEPNLNRVRHEALKWTWLTLKQIGSTHFWSAKLEERMRALEVPVK